MTSLEMRENHLFMRNGFEVTGKWDIPIIKKQDIPLDNVRIYDKNHCLRVEIAYHNEPRLGKGKILHYHIYDERFSKNATGEFSRSRAIRITRKMSIYKKYQKYFRGVTL
jgi:hypothetical protein